MIGLRTIGLREILLKRALLNGLKVPFRQSSVLDRHFPVLPDENGDKLVLESHSRSYLVGKTICPAEVEELFEQHLHESAVSVGREAESAHLLDLGPVAEESGVKVNGLLLPEVLGHSEAIVLALQIGAKEDFDDGCEVFE